MCAKRAQNVRETCAKDARRMREGCTKDARRMREGSAKDAQNLAKRRTCEGRVKGAQRMREGCTKLVITPSGALASSIVLKHGVLNGFLGDFAYYKALRG